MTATMKPMTNEQKEKLMKIRKTFVSISNAKSSAGMYARFVSVMKRLDAFVEKEKLTLVRIDDNGDYHVVDKSLYPWILDRRDPPRSYLWWERIGDRYAHMLFDFTQYDGIGPYVLRSIQRS